MTQIRDEMCIRDSLGASDCKLNEGSMRADVNLSVREVGAETVSYTHLLMW